MFMISAIIILLGGISVTRLPVDLLPDVTYPTVSVFVRYPGVGPQEIEQLITRPIEQTVSAVAGLDQLNSQLVRRHQPRVALVRVGHGSQRGDGRHAHAARPRARTHADRRRADADLPAGLERDADHEPRHRRQLRSRDAARNGREPDRAAARARRRRRRGDDQGRPAPSDSRAALEGKDCGAGSARRTHFRAAPLGEHEHTAGRSEPGRADLSAAQPGPVPEPRRNPQPRADDPRRRADLRPRRRRSRRHDRRRAVAPSHQRAARRAPLGPEAVGHEHGAGRPGHQGRNRTHQRRDAQHQAERPRRQLGVHQQVDPLRAGARADRRRRS